MRIQTLSERTGVSKRNIHYYIKEALLTPKTDPDNGYFDFSEEDYQKLMLIANLRKASFSISVIKAILQNPASAEYYIRMQMGQIQQEIRTSEYILAQINTVLEQFPANPAFADLYSGIVEAEPFTDPARDIPYDGKLINHFLWRTFWEDNMLTEYQQFLWQKINRLTDTREKNPHYASLYDYLCSQDRRKIDALYRERNQHFKQVAALSREDVALYADEMKGSIQNFLSTSPAVQQWKEHYHAFIEPQMHIFTGPIGKLAEEMSPFYRAYRSNSSMACRMVYEWLNRPEGAALKQEILQTLEGFIQLENFGHAELESMNTIFKYD